MEVRPMSIPTHTGHTSVRRPTDGSLKVSDDLTPLQHYIGGEFVDGETDSFTDIVDPSTETVITRIPEGTAADVDRAVVAAVAAKPDWARLVPKQRSERLHRIADRLEQNSEILARLESANTGKPFEVSNDDVAGAIDTFRFMAGALRATTSLSAGDYAEHHLSLILREPLGVVGVVTPWNYPLLMAAWTL